MIDAPPAVPTRRTFEIANDPTRISSLVEEILEELELMAIGDDSLQMKVTLALGEALANALYHGNLELESSLMDNEMEPYYELAEKRLAKQPYASRIIRLEVNQHLDRIQFVVQDEGPGFDITCLPDPTDDDNLERFNGRGLFLIRNLMDQVVFSAKGNQIAMTKWHSSDSS